MLSSDQPPTTNHDEIGFAGTAPTGQRRTRTRRTALVLAASFLVVLALRPVPVLLTEPGPAYPVKFHSAPVAAADTEGVWRFTTVAVSELTGLEWMFAKLGGRSADLVPHQGGDLSERRASDALAMRNSKRVAWTVANQVLGGEGVGEPNGALITAVVEGSPAADAALPMGGRIVSVDGNDILTAAEVSEAVAASGGSTITLEIVDGPGDPRRIDVTPTRDSGTWRIGVELTDSAETTDPEYDIDSTGVGGPSAGLMFTLAYIDALSPGDLTAGLEIAGSGTISTSGTVGPVGGTHHKVIGAAREGATVFFTSTENPVKGPEGVTVVEVSTVHDALRWLCDAGATDDVCLQPMGR